MTIPPRDRGYAVERDTRVVHERYADHASNAQRTTPRGMVAITGGEPVACPVCFPPPPPARARRAWRAEPVEGIAPGIGVAEVTEVAFPRPTSRREPVQSPVEAESFVSIGESWDPQAAPTAAPTAAPSSDAQLVDE